MANERAASPEEDLVRLYLNDIGKYRLLTKDDEVRLAQTAEAGHGAQAELLGDRGITALQTANRPVDRSTGRPVDQCRLDRRLVDAAPVGRGSGAQQFVVGGGDLVVAGEKVGATGGFRQSGGPLGIHQCRSGAVAERAKDVGKPVGPPDRRWRGPWGRVWPAMMGSGEVGKWAAGIIT